MKQSPAPGSSQLLHRGDAVNFRLDLSEPRAGTAWLRTSLGKAQVRREEIVAHFERGLPLRARDWSDLPMTPENDGASFTITVPLSETGRFEAKVYFLEEGSEDPVWPSNEGNSVIHVAAPWTVSGNGIYAAFPRLFGSSPDVQVEAASVKLEELGGKAIRPSGTLRDLERQLDHVIKDLGFGILLLLPVFPVPTSRARMGQFGSPFAGIDFFSIDPALTEFDRIHTPLAQFLDLLDGVHRRGARLFMDVPINHTGWASQLQSRHPEWFVRKEDGTFESPGVWDVQWMDLFQLDYSKRELWVHIADVFLYWCRHGVDGFRCDAGHLLPTEVWIYIIAKVRCEFPDTLFLLEGLGSTPAVSAEMRDMANFDWDYSEVFQQDDRQQLEEHLPRNAGISKSVCLLIDFAETHDNPRMAAKGEAFAKMRTALAALCSTTGGWGITCGVEWFADEKINVH
ncbi:MAG: glycogen debranching protein, partial [Verrucomicrobiota bacterium]